MLKRFVFSVTLPEPMSTPSEPNGTASYTWPASLRLPHEPSLVYLDLSHWIALAKGLHRLKREQSSSTVNDWQRPRASAK